MQRTPTLLAPALAVAIGGILIAATDRSATETTFGERVVGRHRATVALAG